VEIFGLLHLAADREWRAEESVEPFEAVRPDGSRRTFSVPRTPLPDPDLPETQQTQQTQPTQPTESRA
jgi:hypothetical protein